MPALNPEIENWVKLQGKKQFYDKGASPSSAEKMARLYGYAVEAGLTPTVTRIYSSAKHQRDLQARYDAGDTRGLRVRPATNSKHIREDRGQPASDAVDMPCVNREEDKKCAVIARELGLRAGEDFKITDFGHYDVP